MLLENLVDSSPVKFHQQSMQELAAESLKSSIISKFYAT